MSDHRAMDDGAHHSMPGGMQPIHADPHAAHHQTLQRKGYRRSVHDYVIPDLSLLDETGATTSLGQQLDTPKPVMLNFIFTTCTTICPVLSATFSRIQQQLGKEAASLRMISISIDPEMDTPARLKAYAERYAAGSQWRFLTGDLDTVIEAQKAFDIYRGSKGNHQPVTLLRGAGETSWVRIEGIADAHEVIAEYASLRMTE